MAINAISAISYAAYTPYAIDYEHAEIKRQLAAIGLQSSGNKGVDKATLQQAQVAKAPEATDKASTTKPKSEYTSELSFILNKLGIKESGNVDKDYRDAIKVLQERLMSEKDRAEITYLNGLKMQLDRIVRELGYSTLTLAATEQLGASIVGENNRAAIMNPQALNSPSR